MLSIRNEEFPMPLLHPEAYSKLELDSRLLPRHSELIDRLPGNSELNAFIH